MSKENSGTGSSAEVGQGLRGALDAAMLPVLERAVQRSQELAARGRLADLRSQAELRTLERWLVRLQRKVTGATPLGDRGGEAAETARRAHEARAEAGILRMTSQLLRAQSRRLRKQNLRRRLVQGGLGSMPPSPMPASAGR